MAIVANKVPWGKSRMYKRPLHGRGAQTSNNAQIVTMGSQVVGPKVAKKLLDIWLESEFQGGRSAPKVAKINPVDEKYRGLPAQGVGAQVTDDN